MSELISDSNDPRGENKIKANKNPAYDIDASAKDSYHIRIAKEQILDDGKTRVELPNTVKVLILPPAVFNDMKLKAKRSSRPLFEGSKSEILHDPTQKPRKKTV